MVIKVYRVGQVVSSSNKLVFGADAKGPGELFRFPKEFAEKNISPALISGGFLIPVGEISEDQAKWSDAQVMAYLDGRSPSTGGSRICDINKTVPVMIQNWIHTPVTGEAKIYPDCDSVVESVEFSSLTNTQLGTYATLINFDLKIVDPVAGTATSVFESAQGPTKEPLRNCMVGISGGVIADETAHANSAAANDVDLGLAASGTEFVYVGYHTVFDGVAFDIGGTPNAAEATCTVEYPKVTGSGTVAWTSVSNLTDGTISGDLSLAQDGVMIWDRPADWKPTVVASGFGEWYYVRVGSAGAALTAGAVATRMFVINRKLRPYDNSSFVAAGNYLRIDNSATGSQYTGPLQVNINLRNVE